MTKQGLPVPLVWVVIDGLGAACLVLGVFGLWGSPTGAWAILSSPALAWPLIGFGGAAMAVAMSMILTALAQHRRDSSRR